MIKLLYDTPQRWVEAVLQDFDSFLIDHAAAEKKASGMAVSLLSHYPDRPKLVSAMIDLSIEEMTHFREVVKIMTEKGLQLAPDSKDTYVNAFRGLMRRGKEVYMMDRLIIAGIIEARGCERFGLIADALPDGQLKKFYRAITESESRHENLFIDLAREYFADEVIEPRVHELLLAEAEICKALPIQAVLH